MYIKEELTPIKLCAIKPLKSKAEYKKNKIVNTVLFINYMLNNRMGKRNMAKVKVSKPGYLSIRNISFIHL